MFENVILCTKSVLQLDIRREFFFNAERGLEIWVVGLGVMDRVGW